MDEKEEIKSLLDHWLIEERREEILNNYRCSQSELAAGELEFESDIARLKPKLAAR